MDKKRLKKIASLVTSASLIAGSASFFGCTDVESQQEEIKYATQLANELRFKFQFEFPEDVMFKHVFYEQTKRNDNNILGITIDGVAQVGRGLATVRDYDLKMEYSVDDKLYEEFKSADKTDLSLMYNMTSSLIEDNYPMFLMADGEIIYKSETAIRDTSYENVR